MREIKVVGQSIKAISDRQVTGIAAVFGNVDQGGDRIMPGAFTKTLQEGAKRFRHLWHHGQDGWDYFVTPPIAAINSIREVSREELPEMVLAEAPAAAGGLEVVRTYLDTPRGNEVLEILKAGVPLEMSFGYDVILQRYPEEAELVSKSHWRDLLELRLYDTTDCNYGMNSATVAAKSQQFEIWAEKFTQLKKRGAMSESDVEELRKIDALLKTLLEPEIKSRAAAVDTVALTSLMSDLEELATFTGMKTAKQYKYVSTGDKSRCATCAAWDGVVASKAELPEIPNPDCGGGYGQCRCYLIEV